jgi:mannose-1-phosphate guanylyltransferase
MLEFHFSRPQGIATMMGTEATRQQSLNFGCIVEDKNTHRSVLGYTHVLENMLEYFPSSAGGEGARQGN